ncbi:MAG TPA: hypothetical protein VF126_05725 [Acidobacteriaceae bacterium]
MQAVVYRGIGEAALEAVPDPKIQQPTDAILRITGSAICGRTCIFCAEHFPE